MKKNPDPFDTTPVIYITNPYKDEPKVIITHGKEKRRERRKADRKRNK